MTNHFSRSITRALCIWLLALLAACQPETTPLLHVHLSEPTPTLVKTAYTPFNRTLPAAVSVRQQLGLIQSDRLIYVIDSLVAKETRHVLSLNYHPEIGIGAARAFLLDQFNAIRKAAPTLDVWTQPVPFTLNGIHVAPENVVATLPGTDVDAGIIVVGAHYDSISSIDMKDEKAPAPGANENASGVAVLIEIARLLAAQPHRATLVFVAFTAEETGRQGSIAFVKKYLQAQDPPIIPRAMINLDTLGSNTDPNGNPGPAVLRIFSAAPNESPSRQLARQIALAVSAYPEAPTLVVQSSEERIGRFGDQQSFSAEGYAAVRFVEGTEDPTRQRNARDTVDAIQPAYLINATQTALTAVSLLADGLLAPTELVFHTTPTPTLTWKRVRNAAGYVVALRQMASVSFDQVFIIGAAPEFSYPDLTQYALASVAAIDDQGRVGQLSAELALH